MKRNIAYILLACNIKFGTIMSEGSKYKQQNAHQPTHTDKPKLVYTLDRFNLENNHTQIYIKQNQQKAVYFLSVRGFYIFNRCCGKCI